MSGIPQSAGVDGTIVEPSKVVARDLTDRVHSIGNQPGGSDPIRIRKYPNRRLYDTSRSRHVTHDGVLALIAEGRTVQVTDSRTGADITNLVMLQIVIERDPTKLQAIPSALILRAMRADAATLRPLAARALEGWRTTSEPRASTEAPRLNGVNGPQSSVGTLRSAASPEPRRAQTSPPTSAPWSAPSPTRLNGAVRQKARRLGE